MCEILLFSRLIFFFSFFSTVTEWQKTTKLQSKIFFFDLLKSLKFFFFFLFTREFLILPSFLFRIQRRGRLRHDWMKYIFLCTYYSKMKIFENVKVFHSLRTKMKFFISLSFLAVMLMLCDAVSWKHGCETKRFFIHWESVDAEELFNWQFIKITEMMGNSFVII